MATEVSVSRREQGIAVAAVLVCLSLLLAVGLSLVLLATTDTLATGAARDATATLYDAETGLARAMVDLRRLPDWDSVLAGASESGFTDGGPTGTRRLRDGTVIDLESIRNLANCAAPTGCSVPEMNSITDARPWGINNPRWRLFAWGPTSALTQGLADTESARAEGSYLVVLVADDPSETDGNPERDGRPGHGGAGVLLVRAEAFGAGGAHRVIEATVSRARPDEHRDGYSAQQGQARQGPRAAVQSPGGSLAHQEWAREDR
jgi:hypothetical protein